MPPSLRDFFLLDPTVVFLNHGSFGACPKPVFEAYQAWQRRLEQQPVLFLGREMTDLDREARQPLGRHLNTAADNLVFVPNATYGVNVIARSLDLHPGDEILGTNHEYGACNYTWEFICRKTGATYIPRHLPLPARSLEDMVDIFWQGVTPRTRVIYLSHITSPTALRLPVEAICARARQAGILTLIDGAHAPGQLPLDLDALGADWYVGNLHKWMLCPKGVGFLYARPDRQHQVDPLVVSWGFHADDEHGDSSQFQNYLGWTGTKDPAATLSVPAALQFLQDQQWEAVQQRCHRLLVEALERLSCLTGIEPAYPLDSNLFVQMGIAPLPADVDLRALKTRLYAEYRVEVPLTEWQGRKFVRISVQGYNSAEDLAILEMGLQALLPQVRG